MIHDQLFFCKSKKISGLIVLDIFLQYSVFREHVKSIYPSGKILLFILVKIHSVNEKFQGWKQQKICRVSIKI